MSQPQVSFIVPVKDRVHDLRTALASCLAQSIDTWEAVVLDDHSSEDIAGEVASFGDPRLRYQCQDPNLHGIAAARETAIAKARSPILITLDADDINHPHRAHRCLELLDIPSPRLVYTRVRFFDNEDGRNWAKPVFQPYCRELLLLFNFITNPGTAFNLAAYQAAGGCYDYSFSIAEDYDLYLRMAKAGVNIMGLHEEHTSYRKNSSSTTSGQEEAMHKAIMRVRRKHAVPPFALDAIRAYALPELCRNILNDPVATALWSDDRWCGNG